MRKTAVVAGLLGLLALAARWPTMNLPPQGDEDVALAAFLRQPVGKTLTDFAVGANHPLYNLLARYSSWGPPAAWSARLPALLAGVLAPVMLFGSLRARTGEAAAIVAAVLLALAQMQIRLSTFARGYSLAVLLTIVSHWFLLNALERSRRRHWALYALTGALAAYAHAWTLLATAGQVIFFLVELGRANARGLRRNRRRRPSDQARPAAVPPRHNLRAFGAAILLEAILVLALYGPMLMPIMRRAGARGSSLIPNLGTALVEIATIGQPSAGAGEWTLPVHLFVIGCIVVAGAKQRWGQYGDSERTGSASERGQPVRLNPGAAPVPISVSSAALRLVRLHCCVLGTALLLTMIAAPQSFYPRYLAFLFPSYLSIFAAALGAIIAERSSGCHPARSVIGSALALATTGVILATVGGAAWLSESFRWVPGCLSAMTAVHLLLLLALPSSRASLRLNAAGLLLTAPAWCDPLVWRQLAPPLGERIVLLGLLIALAPAIRCRVSNRSIP